MNLLGDKRCFCCQGLKRDTWDPRDQVKLVRADRALMDDTTPLPEPSLEAVVKDFRYHK